MSYIPNSYLLNNIHVPTFVLPVKKVLNCQDNFSIETNSSGVSSIINLNKEEININPYLNLSNFDQETKSWFWYDENEFPLRITREYYNTDKLGWMLNALYPIAPTYNKKLLINENDLSYDKDGKLLGVYTKVKLMNEATPTNEIRVYSGSPMFLQINGEFIADKTDYNNFTSDITLTNKNTDSNKEFYYDIKLNKIYTNQNLAGFDLAEVKLYFFSTTNNVKIKCRISSNTGMKSVSTPVIDSYVVKLHGQYLKG